MILCYFSFYNRYFFILQRLELVQKLLLSREVSILSEPALIINFHIKHYNTLRVLHLCNIKVHIQYREHMVVRAKNDDNVHFSACI